MDRERKLNIKMIDIMDDRKWTQLMNEKSKMYKKEENVHLDRIHPTRVVLLESGGDLIDKEVQLVALS